MPKKLKAGKLPNEMLASLLKPLTVDDQAIVIPPAIGIDAAGLDINGSEFAITTDPVTFANENISKYAIAVNINDVACLGCRPRWFTSVILLPEGMPDTKVYDLWREMQNELDVYGVQLIGGHTEVTPAVNQPIIVGQLIGEAANGGLLDPRKAVPGDKLLLWRGAAVEGTALLARERFEDLTQFIAEAQLETMKTLIDDPGICIWPAAEKLFGEPGLVALHDPTEGGVATALHEVADIAGGGLQIDGDSVPILSETLQLAEILRFNPLGLLASGSLIVVCKPEAEEAILSKLAGDRIACIGEITEDPARVITYKRAGEQEELPRFDQDEVLRALRQPL